MLLENGAMIKQDVIDAFNNAIAANKEHEADEVKFWNFVDADMTMDLSAFYADDYIYECFEALADAYDLEQAAQRLEILKKDFLGMEA